MTTAPLRPTFLASANRELRRDRPAQLIRRQRLVAGNDPVIRPGGHDPPRLAEGRLRAGLVAERAVCAPEAELRQRILGVQESGAAQTLQGDGWLPIFQRIEAEQPLRRDRQRGDLRELRQPYAR